jgi:hypothetical protein
MTPNGLNKEIRIHTNVVGILTGQFSYSLLIYTTHVTHGNERRVGGCFFYKAGEIQMKFLMLTTALCSFVAGYVQAQNIEKRPTDYPVPQCYEGNCVCPDGYSMQEIPAGGETGAGQFACNYEGLTQGEGEDEPAIITGQTETKDNIIINERYDPDISGYTEQGATLGY